MKSKEGILLFVYKNNRTINNQQIKVLFNGDILLNTGSHILLNTEKYDINNIFEKLEGLNTGQAILTGEKYNKLLDYCFRNNIFIKGITHYDDVKEDDVNYINELLSELRDFKKSNRLRNTLFHSLLSELRYIEYEEDNNISTITIQSPINNNVVFSRNNRITFNEMDLNFVNELILLFQEK